MPPHGHGGPPPGGPGGPGGFSGAIPRNSTMQTAHQMYDFRKTTRRIPNEPGLAGTGYMDSDGFTFLGVWHKIQLARVFSIHRPQGTGRARSFIGNYQYLSHDAAMRARFEKMVTQLKKRYDDFDLDDQEFGDRIMWEADRYFGWLKRKTIIDEAEYREKMTEFANAYGIDYDFGDSGPTRGR